MVVSYFQNVISRKGLYTAQILHLVHKSKVLLLALTKMKCLIPNVSGYMYGAPLSPVKSEVSSKGKHSARSIKSSKGKYQTVNPFPYNKFFTLPN